MTDGSDLYGQGGLICAGSRSTADDLFDGDHAKIARATYSVELLFK